MVSSNNMVESDAKNGRFAYSFYVEIIYHTLLTHYYWERTMILGKDDPGEI